MFAISNTVWEREIPFPFTILRLKLLKPDLQMKFGAEILGTIKYFVK